MTRRIAAIAGPWAVVLAASVGTLSAHHSFNMFDMDKNVAYKGVVTEYKWANPHVHITVEIKPEPGVDPATAGIWDVEGGSMNIMGRQGWTRATFKPGDTITLVGHPMRDGSKGISLFYAIMPDGRRLYHDIARPKGEAAR
jgi:hypothetical protein